MCVIPGSEAVRRGYVRGLVDAGLQVQPAGVDLTLMKVEGFRSRGTIGLTSGSRVLSELEEIPATGGAYELKPGCYKVTYNEVVEVPPQMLALSFPRSSLLRCGAYLGNAVWDPGYRGRGSGLLVVHNPEGIRLERNARLVQIIFMQMTEVPQEVYSGAFQGENL
jgi:dUTP pyrophosphatase